MLHLQFHDWLLMGAGLLLGVFLHLASGSPGQGKDHKPRDLASPYPSIASTWKGCPSGWKDMSIVTESVKAYTCGRGDYVVVYNDRSECEHGRRINPPENVWRSCAEIPFWTGN